MSRSACLAALLALACSSGCLSKAVLDEQWPRARAWADNRSLEARFVPPGGPEVRLSYEDHKELAGLEAPFLKADVATPWSYVSPAAYVVRANNPRQNVLVGAALSEGALSSKQDVVACYEVEPLRGLPGREPIAALIVAEEAGRPLVLVRAPGGPWERCEVVSFERVEPSVVKVVVANAGAGVLFGFAALADFVGYSIAGASIVSLWGFVLWAYFGFPGLPR